MINLLRDIQNKNDLVRHYRLVCPHTEMYFLVKKQFVTNDG